MTDIKHRIAVNAIALSTVVFGEPCEIEFAVTPEEPRVPVGVAIRFHKLPPDDLPAMIISIARALHSAPRVSRDTVNAIVLGEGVPAGERVAIPAPAPSATPTLDTIMRERAAVTPTLPATAVKPFAEENKVERIGTPTPSPAPAPSAAAPAKPKKEKAPAKPKAPPPPPAEDLDDVSPDEEEEGSLAVGRDPAGLKGSADRPAPPPPSSRDDDEGLGAEDEVDPDLAGEAEGDAPEGTVTVAPGKYVTVERVAKLEKFFDVVSHVMTVIGGPKRKLTLDELADGLEALKPHSPVLQRVTGSIKDRASTALASRDITIAGMSGS